MRKLSVSEHFTAWFTAIHKGEVGALNKVIILNHRSSSSLHEYSTFLYLWRLCSLTLIQTETFLTLIQTKTFLTLIQIDS